MRAPAGPEPVAAPAPAAAPVAPTAEPAAPRRLPASTWAWHRDALLGAGGAAALAAARGAGVDRIYLYVGPEAEVLEPSSGAAVEALIARCADAGIAVWALLGEPEWLAGSDRLAAASARLAAFQQRAAHPFHGLKLDLEPQARPDWAVGGERRAALIGRYFALLATARGAGALPLWVDCPAQFFRDDQRELLARLAAAVDGATALCYSADDDRVVALAAEALAAWPKELELGLELGTGSPPAETLAGAAPERIAALRARLEQAGAASPRLHGLAFHDLAALAALPAPAPSGTHHEDQP
jgi:hypothetical protein